MTRYVRQQTARNEFFIYCCCDSALQVAQPSICDFYSTVMNSRSSDTSHPSAAGGNLSLVLVCFGLRCKLHSKRVCMSRPAPVEVMYLCQTLARLQTRTRNNKSAPPCSPGGRETWYTCQTSSVRSQHPISSSKKKGGGAGNSLPSDRAQPTFQNAAWPQFTVGFRPLTFLTVIQRGSCDTWGSKGQHMHLT